MEIEKKMEKKRKREEKERKKEFGLGPTNRSRPTYTSGRARSPSLLRH
jgi:hypothetical protein